MFRLLLLLLLSDCCQIFATPLKSLQPPKTFPVFILGKQKIYIQGVSIKIGISDLTCVGWLSAILTGHMIPFWNPWDLTSALGMIISFMIILWMTRKV